MTARSLLRRPLTLAMALAIAIAGVGVAAASPATAVTSFPDTDQVSGSVSGNSMSGSITWTSYRYASGRITVKNDLTDGNCVALQQRVKTATSTGSWKWVGSVCFDSSGTFAVSTPSTSTNFTHFEFRIYEVQSGGNAYSAIDSNSPLGS